VPSLYDLTRGELTELLEGEPGYRVDQVWDGLYRRALEPRDITTISMDLRSRLSEALPPALREAASSYTADRTTAKWLFELSDGATVETVLMHYHDRSTVCVSTQAGCAMGCGFCATGQNGFRRHLTTGEIVEQVMRAVRTARPRRVSNVVFMGMGEPLANYGPVWGAVERLHGDLGLSARHLTVSTVGVVPGIRRLTRETLPVNLAVSLHAANDELRSRLVPINQRYPLDDLLTACADYYAAKRRRVSFEWALMDGVNDRSRDAQELAEAAGPLRAHVNLIPLNPTPGYPTRGTPPERVAAFRDHLETLGVNVTVRRNRGADIDAACGQLRSTEATAVGIIARGR
jgi:23S rRNA (adenine2503-C2)-methyltransferase